MILITRRAGEEVLAGEQDDPVTVIRVFDIAPPSARIRVSTNSTLNLMTGNRWRRPKEADLKEGHELTIGSPPGTARIHCDREGRQRACRP